MKDGEKEKERGREIERDREKKMVDKIVKL